jgi:hypothetical protein
MAWWVARKDAGEPGVGIISGPHSTRESAAAVIEAIDPEKRSPYLVAEGGSAGDAREAAAKQR